MGSHVYERAPHFHFPLRPRMAGKLSRCDLCRQPPRAHPGWQTWSALDFRPACPQPERYVGARRGVRQVDEDCLYLNVYTPSVSADFRPQLPGLTVVCRLDPRASD